MYNPLRTFIRRSLWWLGYRVYSKNSLPVGNNILRDVSLDTNPTKIERIFDVGANVGQAAFMLRELFPQAEIYSFEPIPAVCDDLKRNLGHLSNIKCYELAFGDEIKKQTIYLQEKSRCNSLRSDLNKPSSKMGGDSVLVEVTTLDAFCRKESIRCIDFLKIDAEGCDIEVLKGGVGLLREGCIKYILIETTFNGEDEPRYTSFEEVKAFLYQYGYRLRAIYHQATNDKPYLAYADTLFLLQPKNG